MARAAALAAVRRTASSRGPPEGSFTACGATAFSGLGTARGRGAGGVILTDFRMRGFGVEGCGLGSAIHRRGVGGTGGFTSCDRECGARGCLGSGVRTSGRLGGVGLTPGDLGCRAAGGLMSCDRGCVARGCLGLGVLGTTFDPGTGFPVAFWLGTGFGAGLGLILGLAAGCAAGFGFAAGFGLGLAATGFGLVVGLGFAADFGFGFALVCLGFAAGFGLAAGFLALAGDFLAGAGFFAAGLGLGFAAAGRDVPWPFGAASASCAPSAPNASVSRPPDAAYRAACRILFRWDVTTDLPPRPVPPRADHCRIPPCDSSLPVGTTGQRRSHRPVQSRYRTGRGTLHHPRPRPTRDHQHDDHNQRTHISHQRRQHPDNPEPLPRRGEHLRRRERADTLRDVKGGNRWRSGSC
ncbi:phage holin family protein [Saccharothrix sp. NPDC042600]|uniref:phage holin family protein n=1 Tax=Saccharothrix TaxID=2071 RepID=UPI0033EF664E|nr:hypothetical protein GCM10017745_48690 [Saccharothrix mutabilis subsp. capreolus]